jgi:P4 family phage/plasmid primase-like protien
MAINLKTGIYYRPDLLEYHTKIAAVAASPPGTSCPMWMAFLHTVTGGDLALIAFLKRFLGYCLTGYVTEHSLLFLFGTGGNGKSVFTATVTEIMGDYTIVAPMEMFLASNVERHPTEIAKLRGRLVVAHETQGGRRWDEGKIKILTGGDKLTGRFMRGDFFDFKPTHKFLISANHKPSFRTVDEAIRRRFLLVPFTVCIPKADRDPLLAEKLKAEWPAILRWMVDGCLEWRQFGLMVPEIVRAATDDYLGDQDSLGQWAGECVEKVAPNVDPNAFVTTRKLFGSWKAWCAARNLSPGTETAFADSLKDRGYEQKRTMKARGFKWLRLISDAGDDAELQFGGGP